MDSHPSEPLDARARKRIYNRHYYAANKGRLREASSAYQRTNRVRLNAHRRCRYSESERQRKQGYYLRNRERILQQKRDYYIRKRHQIDAYRTLNAKRLSAANSRWHQQNRDRIRERKRNEGRRRRERVVERIASNFRRKIGKWMKMGGVKAAQSKTLLGCSFEEFRRHLERQFKRRMTWQNYGRTWHIDHIIPCSAFDLTRPQHVWQCFHFSNLRPLWARANLRKGAKITDPQLKLRL